jgi:transcriptional regulator with XRE-family HTH domain
MRKEHQTVNTQTEIKPEGRFSQALAARMEDLGLSTRDVAMQTRLSYEHIRKLKNGEANPSEYALKKLCELLALDYEEMNELSVADKCEDKFGGIPHKLIHQHPELSLIAPLWDMLTDDQKGLIRLQIKSIAENNKKFGTMPKVARVV